MNTKNLIAELVENNIRATRSPFNSSTRYTVIRDGCCVELPPSDLTDEELALVEVIAEFAGATELAVAKLLRARHLEILRDLLVEVFTLMIGHLEVAIRRTLTSRGVTP
jgi:hypothetical protein